jgi:hypothetical protein
MTGTSSRSPHLQVGVVHDNDSGLMCPGQVAAVSDVRVAVSCDDGVDGHYSIGYFSWSGEAWTDAVHHWAAAS